MLLSIAEHLAERQNFRNYSFKEDFVQDAVLVMLKACRTFDLSRKANGRPASAFAYLTTTAWFEFCSTIRKESRRGLGHVGVGACEVLSMPSMTLGLFSREGVAEQLGGTFASPDP